jgi:hypothetical protein
MAIYSLRTDEVSDGSGVGVLLDFDFDEELLDDGSDGSGALGLQTRTVSGFSWGGVGGRGSCMT